jgi:hypothetical protein
MAKYNDITLKQNANTFRGLAGEIKLAQRSLTFTEIGRLPAGTELTLELDNTTEIGLLLPAVQKVRDAAARAEVVQLKLDQVDSVFLKMQPTAVMQKVLGAGRQGYSIKLRKS